MESTHTLVYGILYDTLQMTLYDYHIMIYTIVYDILYMIYYMIYQNGLINSNKENVYHSYTMLQTRHTIWLSQSTCAIQPRVDQLRQAKRTFSTLSNKEAREIVHRYMLQHKTTL